MDETRTLPAARMDAADAGDRFAAAWLNGPPPNIDEFVPADGPGRSAVLVELCARDLLYGLRAGEDRRVDTYLARYPELAADIQAKFRLAQAEAEARRPLSSQAITVSLPAADDPAATTDPDDPAARQVGSAWHAPADPEAATRTLSSSDPATAKPERGLPTLPNVTLTRILGRGGMGVVYEGMQTTVNRQVAVKMVLHVDASPAQRLRFALEAEAIAALRHPNVVALYEFGSHAGQPYFVLEHVGGGSLQDALANGALPPTRAAEVAAAVADAVAAAHDAGIIHRDLKPANVLLTPDGAPKLTDFGLARRGDSGLTASGAVMGTPQYMAPEQARGDTKGVGTPADIWGLGGILYACLTGKPPFSAAGGGIPEVLRRVEEEPPVRPRSLNPHIPRDLEVICLKCLEKPPAARYRSAASVADDLRRWAAGETILARPPGVAELAVRWVRRRPAVAALYATLATTVVVGTVAAYEVRARAERAARRAEAVALVDQLATAESPRVPEIAAKLLQFPAEAAPLLSTRAAVATDPRELLHLVVARLPAHPELADELVNRLLTAEPSSVPVAVNALADSPPADLAPLWAAATGDEADRSLRATAALARLAPNDPRWGELAPRTAGRLVRAPLALQDAITACLTGATRGKLTASLMALYRQANTPQTKDDSPDRQAERAVVSDAVTGLLARLAGGQPKELAALVAEMQPRHHAVLFPLLAARPAEANAGFRELLAATHDPRRQAVAAASLLRLGDVDPVWPLFRPGQPDRRTAVIHIPITYGVGPRVLVDRYPAESDLTARRSLLLALGDYSPDSLPEAERTRLVAQLRTDYATHPDPGLHAAAGWLLRRWKLPPDDAALPRGLAADRGWLVNGQGQQFSIVRGPVDFVMGAPPNEGDPADSDYETPRQVIIPRSFAIAQTEVTTGQFTKLVPHPMAAELGPLAPTPDFPIVLVSWYMAAEYCNALSKAEGLPESQWCYAPNKDGKYAPGMMMKPNYTRLTGYRLPTDAEWEYACRAGTTGPRFLGASAEFLPRYAALALTSDWHAQPVGQLRPNDLGLFDAYGNVAEWAADIDRMPVNGPLAALSGGTVSVAAGLDTGLDLQPADTDYRSVRGAAFESPTKYARSAYRNGLPPQLNASSSTGFRLARTIPTVSR